MSDSSGEKLAGCGELEGEKLTTAFFHQTSTQTDDSSTSLALSVSLTMSHSLEALPQLEGCFTFRTRHGEGKTYEKLGLALLIFLSRTDIMEVSFCRCVWRSQKNLVLP